MFKVIEAFSGIGAQAKALERIGGEYCIINTCDWDMRSIIAYCLIHKGKIDVKKYEKMTNEEIDEFLLSQTISLDGKKPMSSKYLLQISFDVKRILYTAIKETGNLVSITDVKGANIPEDIDLFTYSFPCQDLSACGYWHGNKSGISRDAHNRSGMLWEVERILKEMFHAGKRLPRFLVMENVTNILSRIHKADFDDWKITLENLGYYNHVYRLNAKNFGVPQKRERAYMISILYENDIMKYMQLCQYFEEYNLQNQEIAEQYKGRSFRLKDVLKLDYSNEIYRNEADANQPNDTPSREKIFKENEMLYDGVTIKDIDINTITTKQDRNPNSGLITYHNGISGKTNWRYLTPRECFMLMGFDEEDYNRIILSNTEYRKGKFLFTNESLIKMAGNSICVNVLEALFKQIMDINRMLFEE